MKQKYVYGISLSLCTYKWLDKEFRQHNEFKKKKKKKKKEI